MATKGVPMPGSLGPAKPATADVQKLCDQVKGEVFKKDGRNLHKFHAVSFATQTVAGTNYIILVESDCQEYFLVKIYVDLHSKVELKGFQKGKNKDTPLALF
ncbi:hypothetical protein XENTR_v10004712 [Xenopus tropicalis]|uniref:Cystatin-A n=1 Tax=Xenopus tropicalis TaxID=8364 RepID=A0A8J1J2X7_XENTR|eukprot:XP_012813782.1 PREDICTED: cystatin-A-like [Xenopus tropicalis]